MSGYGNPFQTPREESHQAAPAKQSPGQQSTFAGQHPIKQEGTPGWFRLPSDYESANPRWQPNLARDPIEPPSRSRSPMLFTDQFSGPMRRVPQRYSYLPEDYHASRPRSNSPGTSSLCQPGRGRRGLTPIQLRVIPATINHPDSMEARAFQQIQAAADSGTPNDAMTINYYRDMSPNPASDELIRAREGEGRAPYQLVRQTYRNNTFRGTTNFVTGVTHPRGKVAEHLELPD